MVGSNDSLRKGDFKENCCRFDDDVFQPPTTDRASNQKSPGDVDADCILRSRTASHQEAEDVIYEPDNKIENRSFAN